MNWGQMSSTDLTTACDPPPKPFPRAVEVDKPEGEPYRLLSVAPPLGESGAPLLDEVLADLQARREDQVQLHVDVVANHFVDDPRVAVEEAKKGFLIIDLALAQQLLRR